MSIWSRHSPGSPLSVRRAEGRRYNPGGQGDSPNTLSGQSHRAATRPAPRAASPRIERDPTVLESYLSDAAHVPGGVASGIAFPADAAEVAAVVAEASRILPIGAQSSLTGGATPRGDVLLGTRRLSAI